MERPKEEKMRVRQGKDKKRRFKEDVYLLDKTDEELGDFIGDEERKGLEYARKHREETKGRDMCKEHRERKEKEAETLTKRNEVLEDHARDLEKQFNDYKATTEQRFDKIAQMLKGVFKSSS